jgi:murein DD-endopeptidase MepM/ murein hydrolase activator NlpD
MNRTTTGAGRPLLRRALLPTTGLAAAVGIALGGPGLAAQATETPAPETTSAQQGAEQAAAERTYSSPVPAGTGSPTSEFASPDRPTHVGTDFAVETGTPVTAVSGGTVLRTAETGEGGALSHHTGKGVVIDHGEINGDRMYSYYGHLDEVQVEPGDTVEAGTQIAESGNTGNSTGPHLHLGVYMNDDDPGGAIWKESTGVGFIDPVDWLERKGVDAGQDAPVDP